MPRIVLTEEQVTTLIRELRGLDLSDKPASQDLLRRLERLTERNYAARYPTPPAEGTPADLSEKNANSQTRRGRGRKAAVDDSSAWRCDPQDPSSQLNEGATPTQSVFALVTAAAAARATIRHFESRHHPQPDCDAHADVFHAQQGEGRTYTSGVRVDIKVEEEPEDHAMVETPGLRKSKRRTRVETRKSSFKPVNTFLCWG